MHRPLRVLLVEDNPADGELLRQELRRAGFAPEWERVETEADFLRQLRADFEIVISDYSLPRFSGFRALELLQASGHDWPFILVSGTIGEATAVEAVKRGATDYLLKDRLGRLGSAVHHALKEAQARRDGAQAARILLDSERRYRLMFESNPQPMWVFDRDTLRFLAVNDAALAHYGYARDEFLAMTIRDIRPAEELPFLAADLAQAGLPAAARTWVHRRKDGTLLHVRIDAHDVRFGDRSARLVMANDETARRQAEDTLRSTHAQLEQLLVHSPVVIYESTVASDRLVLRMVSGNIGRLLGFAPAETLNQEWWYGALAPEDRDRAIAGINLGLQQGSCTSEYRLRHKDGTVRWVRDRRQLVRDASGKPSAWVGAWTDITEHMRAEETLRTLSSQQAGREATRTLVEVALILGLTAACAYWFKATDILQAPVEAIFSRHRDIIDECIGTLTVLLIALGIFSYRRWREARSQVREERNVQAALRVLHAELESGVRQRTAQLAAANEQLLAEIADRTTAEAALRTSEERFRQLAENITEVFWLSAPDEGSVLYVSPTYEAIWGRSAASLLASPQTWLEAIHPDDRERIRQALPSQATGSYNEEYRVVRPDGSVRWIHDRAFPVRDGDGVVYRIAGVARDITEKKQMEAKFFRAQRMEAIGSLASGIAHDLNNILAPIMMLPTLIRISKSPAATEKALATVEASAQRGAELVRQLLTFGRGVEGEKRSLPCGPLLLEMEAIARQTFPKNVTIATRVAEATWPIFGDSTQVHQILLNLCVNARDAMPQGGMLRLAAENAAADELEAADITADAAGGYVRLTVQDTGTGMTPDIVEKIFDPFFTTKGPGRGTGLGLSTVQGIVKSHAGFLRVKSEPGRGTIFSVYLPAAVVPQTTVPGPAIVALAGGQGECVLVADDEEMIRDTLRESLTASGYTVMVARDGLEGLAHFAASGDKIKLVITDFDMPNMDGLALIRALKQRKPELKFIVSSGLSSRRQLEARQVELDLLGVEAVLAKPYTVEQLLAAVRRALPPQLALCPLQPCPEAGETAASGADSVRLPGTR